MKNCGNCGHKHHTYEPHVPATYVDPWTDPRVNTDLRSR